MKKKNAANEPSKTTMIGTSIAGIRVLVFELDDLCVPAVEVVAAVALAVPLPTTLGALLAVPVEAALKAPAAEREESWAEFETTIRTPVLCQ
jgi:hypothetical protein